MDYNLRFTFPKEPFPKVLPMVKSLILSRLVIK
jgi:hypothetical protein